MKQLFSIIILTFVVQIYMIPQTCLPEGIDFSTQKEIDDFIINNPNCTTIEGDVTISGSYITNLGGLSVITSIEGYLAIGYELNGNPLLNDLTGLNNLKTVQGGLIIQDNIKLSNLYGLTELGAIDVGIWIINNDHMTSLDGLDSLINIRGEIQIQKNNLLTSLKGLSRVAPGNIDLILIRDNYSLTSCESNVICTFLTDSLNVAVNDNGQGCDNPSEVLIACESLGIQTTIINNLIGFYPNPASDLLNLYNNSDQKITEINIYNQLGQKIAQYISTQNYVDISMFKNGLYVIEIVTNKTKQRNKLIIK